MNTKEAFLAGYKYGWENEHVLFGNTRDSKPEDDHVDNGVIAARQDKHSNKEYNPEAAWQKYSQTLMVTA